MLLKWLTIVFWPHFYFMMIMSLMFGVKKTQNHIYFFQGSTSTSTKKMEHKFKWHGSFSKGNIPHSVLILQSKIWTFCLSRDGMVQFCNLVMMFNLWLGSFHSSRSLHRLTTVAEWISKYMDRVRVIMASHYSINSFCRFLVRRFLIWFINVLGCLVSTNLFMS